MNKLLKNLEDSFKSHSEARVKMKTWIQQYTDFEIEVVWQPGDGFTVLAIESGLNVAPLETCLKIIEEKGILTLDEFNKNLI